MLKTQHLHEPCESAAACRVHWDAPGAAYRGKPFWSWNGELDIDELKRQVGVLKDMGMGGFFMHSRTGLVTEYLGKDWFDAINATADEGERLGMEAWIYDEDRWPSGSAGGMATEDEAYQMKHLRCRVVKDGTIDWPEEDKFLAAFHAELEDLKLGAYQRIEYKDGSPCPEGKVTLLFTWELMPRDSFYNGNTYLDTLDPDSVEHFLKITHDRYGEECGNRMGGSIPGVFTDEPHRGFVMLGEVWSAEADDPAMTASWTPKLPEAYREAFGTDLFDVLPEVYFQKDGERFSPHKWRYMEILQRLFLDNWAKPCLDRSHQHGLAMTGHILHEDSLGAQACPSGAVARYYEHMDVPGIDLLGNTNPSYWVAKQVQSVSRQMNKPWILSELYGCTGWQMGFDGHKRIGDWQALFGVNLRCQHLSWYTMAGEAKRDYPASIFFQSPWWREYEVVETYYARLHTALQSGKPMCDVLVVSPVESIWAQIFPGWAKWLEAADEEMVALDNQYKELFHWLLGSRIDFDYGDEDHIDRFAKVVKDADGPLLELGQMRYRTVVVGGCKTLRASTMAALQTFIEQGGRVIFTGEAPAYVDAIPSNSGAELAAAASSTEWDRDAIIEALSQQTVSSKLKIDGASEAVFAQVRELEDGWFVVLLNTSETEAFESVSISLEGGQSLDQWDALSGVVKPHASSVQNGSLVWETELSPLAERVYHVKRSTSDAVVEETVESLGDAVELHGPWGFKLGEPNLLVLDYAELSIKGGDFSEPIEVLKIEEKLCELTDSPLRTGTMVQPWARTEADTAATGLPVELQFHFEVEKVPSGECTLMAEQLKGKTVSLNGTELEEVAGKDAWMIDPCFRKLAIPAGCLRVGRNTVTLRFDFSYGVDIEALYLCGEFGVFAAADKQSVQLGAFPETLENGDLTSQGLFFYGDRVVYEIPVDQVGRLQVEAEGASCVAFTGSRERRVVPWGDFAYTVTEADVAQGKVTCELILTRRNTFGPLHNTTTVEPMVGPPSFRTTGKDWTDEYMVLPCGLTSVKFSPAIANL